MKILVYFHYYVQSAVHSLESAGTSPFFVTRYNYMYWTVKAIVHACEHLLNSFWCPDFRKLPNCPLGHLSQLVHLHHNPTAPLAARMIILLMYFVRLKFFSVHVMVKVYVALPRSQSHSSSLLLDEYTTLWGEPEWVHACTKCGVVARNVGHASACAEHWAVACIWPLSECDWA